MSTVVSLSNETKSAQADAMARLLDDGQINVYDGTPPATAETALSGNTLLGTLQLSATSAPAASNGLLTFNAVTDDSSIDATGTATFYRAFKTDGTSVVLQGTVGATSSGESMELDNTALVAGGTLSITSWTHQV